MRRKNTCIKTQFGSNFSLTWWPSPFQRRRWIIFLLKTCTYDLPNGRSLSRGKRPSWGYISVVFEVVLRGASGIMESLDHLLHHFKSGWAVVNILFVYMNVISPFFLGKVRKTGAVSGPNGINAALIGFIV